MEKKLLEEMPTVLNDVTIKDIHSIVKAYVLYEYHKANDPDWQSWTKQRPNFNFTPWGLGWNYGPKGRIHDQQRAIFAYFIIVILDWTDGLTQLSRTVNDVYRVPKDSLSKEFNSLMNTPALFNSILNEINKTITEINATLSEPKTESLTEDIEKHDKLNPKLFGADNKLKPEVLAKVKKIVKLFIEDLQENAVYLAVKDIRLIGSNVSYNYTKDSDLDMHIIADTNKLDCPAELYKALYSAYRSLFNKNFDIDFYGIPVELYIETDDSPTISNGMYSIRKNDWVKVPTQENIPEIDREAFDKQFIVWENRYNDLINSAPTSDAIDLFIQEIYDLRKLTIAKDGEYGLGNLIFKEMRNKGYLDNLKELKNKTISKELSLESLQEDTIKQKNVWVNKGTEGTHGKFNTKKKADAQRKAMFANGYKTKNENIVEELDSRTLNDYRQQIMQIAHSQPIIHSNGNFEIHLVKEFEVDNIINRLQKLPFICRATKVISGKYDFNNIDYLTNMPSRYFTIRGEICE